jgi:endonuclease/exonuclease/phosphatase family metal-dependent hydrolase
MHSSYSALALRTAYAYALRGVNPNSQTLTVLTWNVHGCIGRDGKLDVDRVARVLASSDADVIGLQEVDCRKRLPSGETQLARLAAMTGLEAIAGPTRREGDGYFGNALLTRHAVGNVAYVDVTVEGREPRGILHVTLHIGDAEVELFNTHFGLKISERRQQVERLVEVAEGARAATVIVLGDFNEWRSRAAALAQLKAAFGKTPAVRSFPSGFPILALDRVWVRPRSALGQVRALVNGLTRVASDHLPVYAHVEL